MTDRGNKMQLDEGEILLREGLIKFPSTPGEKPHIIARKCKKCSDIAFPGKERCGKCDSTEMEEVLLSNKGKIYSYTIVMQTIPGYEVPNIVAVVKMPEDDTLMIMTQIKDCSIQEVRCGMEVETIIADLFTKTNGQRVVGYAFRPSRGSDK